MPAKDLIYAMLSDSGRVRRGNEDACAAAPLYGAFVVCDGMGGAAGGEVASHLAAETFLSQVVANDAASTRARIAAAVQTANRTVFQQAQRTPQLCGMGTTLVGLLRSQDAPDEPVPTNGNGGGYTADPLTLWLVHVGDSRCYLWRRNQLKRMTNDHSLVEEQVRAGQITPEQAIASPMRNLITRVVGSQPAADPEIHGYRPQEGDLYLLATDGLTGELSDDEIAAILERVPASATQPDLHEACRELVQAANDKGGRDNITVLLVALSPP